MSSICYPAIGYFMSKVKIEYEKMLPSCNYDLAYVSLNGYDDLQVTVSMGFDRRLGLGIHFKDTPATGEYSGSLATPWFEGKGGWDKPIEIDFAVSNDSIFIDFNISNLKQYNLTLIDFIELIEAISTAARFLQSENGTKPNI